MKAFDCENFAEGSLRALVRGVCGPHEGDINHDTALGRVSPCHADDVSSIQLGAVLGIET